MIRALKEMHRAQDSVDARNDVEMIRCLRVWRGEIPEAGETLRRMLGVGGVGMDENERLALEHGEHGADTRNTELDR